MKGMCKLRSFHLPVIVVVDFPASDHIVHVQHLFINKNVLKLLKVKLYLNKCCFFRQNVQLFQVKAKCTLIVIKATCQNKKDLGLPLKLVVINDHMGSNNYSHI